MAKQWNKHFIWAATCPDCGGEWVEGTYAEGCLDCGTGTRYGYSY